MGTEKDYQNRLPGHQQPLGLCAHEDDEPAVAGQPARRADGVHHRTDRDLHSAGAFGWAVLALIAVVALVGAVYYFAPRGQQGAGLMAGNGNAFQQAFMPESGGYAQVSEVVEVSAPDLGTARSISPADASSSAAQVAGVAVVGDVVYLFPLNGADIKEDAGLNKVAKAAAETGADVTVTAYTDESGKPAYNQRLSERRARRVGDYLVAHGVPRNHVKTIGRGPTHAYANAAQDRRAEVHIDR